MLVGGAEHVDDLVLDHFLHVGAGIAEVLARVKVRRILGEVFSDGGREGDAQVGVDVDLADGKRGGLFELGFGDADGVGHGTAVLVDDGDLFLRHAGSAVEHDGEAPGRRLPISSRMSMRSLGSGRA